MNKIADFNSVLEIAFGLNLLFYYFEAIPRFEDRLKLLEEANRRLVREKIEATKNREVFPTGFVINSRHSSYKVMFTGFSLLMSFIVLGVLIYGSFHPDAQLSTFLIWVLLLAAFAIPSLAFLLHSRVEKFAERANSFLEDEIQSTGRGFVGSNSPRS